MTQKFKIFKGVEADFYGAPEGATCKITNKEKTRGSYVVYAWADGLGPDSRAWPCNFDYSNGLPCYKNIGSVFGLNQIEVLAERRPITEPQPDADGWIEWKGGDCPVKQGGEVRVRYRNGKEKTFVSSGISRLWERGDIIAYRLSQPEKPAWNGQGLPPVGVECEFMFKHDLGIDWNNFRCVAIDSEVAFGWSGKEPTTLYLSDFKFRPIRTQDEIEREQAVAEMKSIIDFRFIGKPLSSGYAAQDLYDAGYRKVTK